MMFVMVGTHHQPFNRLLVAVEGLPGEKTVQYGHSTHQPVGCTNRAFVPFDEAQTLLKQADVVITHAGTGTVMMALAYGKRPVVAPRLKQFGEHVDDHQLELVATLHEAGLIEPWLPGDDLAAAVARARTGGNATARPPALELVAFLKNQIET